MTMYTYTKEKVAIDKLIKEIQDSTITIALDKITTYSTSLYIYFKADLSSTEENIMDDIVSNHDGEPLPENENPVTVDKRPIVNASPRPIKTYTFFSSSGDNTSDLMKVSHGNKMKFKHLNGDGTGEHSPIYFDFNTITNATYLHGGFMQWKGCQFDEIEVEIVGRSSEEAISKGTNTNYEVVDGILVMTAGNGTKLVDWTKVFLVEMVPDEFGSMPPAYWDADFNASTKEFENITFNSQGKGKYNIFAEETELNCFIPLFIMLGDDSYELGSHDVSRVGQNMRIKLIPTTVGTDHDWSFCASINLYRERTF